MTPDPLNYRMIGQVIQNRRRELGLSQSHLADFAGCSVTHICRIEAGSKVSLRLLFLLSKELKIPMDVFFPSHYIEDSMVREIVSLISSRPAHEHEFLKSMLEHTIAFLSQMERDHLYRPHAIHPYLSTEKGKTVEPPLVAETPLSYSAAVFPLGSYESLRTPNKEEDEEA